MQYVRRLPLSIKWVLFLVIFVSSFVVSMVYGAADIHLRDLWQALTMSVDTEKGLILYELRLPREIGAIFVGAGLAVAGAIMQGLTRNPLADPGLLGLTAGANLALTIALAFLPSAGYLGLLIASFIGAALGATLVFGIASAKKGGFSPFRIVLAGAAITAFLTAIAEAIGLYFQISKDVSMWTAGGLIGTAWAQLQWVVPIVVIASVMAFILARQLTILSLDEELAIGLGQKVGRTKALLFVIIILLTGASVALVGNLTFVGLMIPHMVRAFVGTDYRVILPVSVVFGASFMLLADTVARTINAPFETPVSAIVGVFGLCFFLFVVKKGGKEIA
ncbi:iron ABC transporter permease [Gracilibacillus caseinilyticus]|uniref:Iron ABC transporter permease n=1 Tax=Gracilibacillus caseinilyticus TaxID=2932256 RepID=A0ABY4EXW5_9BACI|nr:iron ABC transporter permease [Gracilibacillus caseinilyticus]UOQ49252.1 iron ABC transporter permease [Gracilibacillus caseinilyticus]